MPADAPAGPSDGDTQKAAAQFTEAAAHLSKAKSAIRAVVPSGEARLFRAPSRGSVQATDADATWTGASGGDRAGDTLLAPIDLDGDAYADLLLAAPGLGGGAVYAVRGGPGL